MLLVEFLVIVGINAMVIFFAGAVLDIPIWLGITISILFWVGAFCVLCLLFYWATEDFEKEKE